MADPRMKQLRIKTGVLKRMTKEKVSYEKEAEQIMGKIKEMQEEGKEVYYIKKQDELLQETTNVITDCQRRLNAAFTDMKTLIENETDLHETAEFKAAKVVLDEAKAEVTQ